MDLTIDHFKARPLQHALREVLPPLGPATAARIGTRHPTHPPTPRSKDEKDHQQEQEGGSKKQIRWNGRHAHRLPRTAP